jgi:hypothetical protein
MTYTVHPFWYAFPAAILCLRTNPRPSGRVPPLLPVVGRGGVLGYPTSIVHDFLWLILRLECRVDPLWQAVTIRDSLRLEVIGVPGIEPMRRKRRSPLSCMNCEPSCPRSLMRLLDLAGGNGVPESTLRRWRDEMIGLLAARAPRLERPCAG